MIKTMSQVIIYAPLEKLHSQLSFDTLRVKIGSQMAEEYGIKLHVSLSELFLCYSVEKADRNPHVNLMPYSSAICDPILTLKVSNES